MGDWLKVFGTYQPNLPAGLGVDDYYIPTNDKSLVVSHSISIPLVYIISTVDLTTGIHSLSRNFRWCSLRLPNGRQSRP